MDYNYFIKVSSTIDRKESKLPDDVNELLIQIKKKLNITKNNFKNLNFYEKPTIKKNDDIINELYKNLNKITSKTYDKLSIEIINIVTNEENINDDDKKKICYHFFEIITKNKIFSQLYAKLYNEFIIKNQNFKNIFKEQLFNYLKSFNTIEYVSSNENYDKYCLYVKQIEKINNFTLFLLTCLEYNICSIDEIIKFILLFQDKLTNFFSNKDKIYENDCYVSNIYTILKSEYVQKNIISHESWNVIKENNKKLQNLNGPGKNNKIKFKLMYIKYIIDKL